MSCDDEKAKEVLTAFEAAKAEFDELNSQRVVAILKMYDYAKKCRDLGVSDPRVTKVLGNPEYDQLYDHYGE
jgi:hypothetical protein